MVFFMKVLVIGDFHIPTRAKEIPRAILEFIVKERPDLILSPGDFVVQEVYRQLETYAPVKAVLGNMDEDLNLPKRLIVEIYNFKVGLIHGDGIFPRGNIKKLTKIALDMNVDVLIHGHTHKLSIDIVNVSGRNILLVNPGSATGVWGGGGGSLVPEFAILYLTENSIQVIGYRVIEGNVKVFKTTSYVKS